MYIIDADLKDGRRLSQLSEKLYNFKLSSQKYKYIGYFTFQLHIKHV